MSKTRKSSGHSTLANSFMAPSSKIKLSLQPSRDSCIKDKGKDMSQRMRDLIATMYPGIKVGHTNCIPKYIFVPSTKGWLWNSEDAVTVVSGTTGLQINKTKIFISKQNNKLS